MAKFRMLILDDEVEWDMRERTKYGKGYYLIEEWFPWVFEVVVATGFYKGGGEETLRKEKFDILLLDVSLGQGDGNGLEVLSRLRANDPKWGLGGPNLNIWIIGCSTGWEEYRVGLTKKGNRQLDGRATEAVGLRQELARFLELQK